VTRLAFLVDQLFAAAPGGMGTYVRELVPALQWAGPDLDITLFHSRFEGPRPEWLGGRETVELPWTIRRSYPTWALLGRPALPAALAEAQLVHSPSPAAIPPAGDGQRLVVTVHDVAFLVHPELFPRQWSVQYRAALRRVVHRADAIITVSRHTAEDLARRTRVDHRRVHVTPLAASLPSGTTDPGPLLDRLKIPRPYLLFVGTLEPRKNLLRLLRAYRRLAVDGLRHALVLAGPMGWHPQPLLHEASATGPGEVVLTGAIGSELELDALYRAADALVYPSLYEGFGLPLVEAMARGVPCVASTSSSLPEVAGDAALLVDPRSTASIAEAIDAVVNDRPLAARLRTAGLARAARFRWDRTAQRTLEVYRGLL
jgi:glycosyltransferase involved in cell wall biosynthesis